MAPRRYYHQYARDRRRREEWARRYEGEESPSPSPLLWLPAAWAGMFGLLFGASQPTGWAAYDFVKLTLWTVLAIVGLAAFLVVTAGITRMTPEGQRRARWRRWAGPNAKPPRSSRPS